MITLYTGTPGSGKSLHAARDIMQRMRRGRGLICNFFINLDAVPKRQSDPLCVTNLDLSPQFLYDYAMQHHVRGKEHQTLIVIDEAQLLFNCRDFGDRMRPKWVEFFTLHRHIGYDILLITQFDRMLDRQIRSLVEYEVRHRKITNYKLLGLLLSMTGRPWFIAIERWYGMTGKDAICSTTFFSYRKKYGQLYDSYARFASVAPPGGSGGNREAVGPQGNRAGKTVSQNPGISEAV